MVSYFRCPARVIHRSVDNRHTSRYTGNRMKAVRWGGEKNEWLKANRNVGFELVAFKIAAGEVLDIVEHRNKDRYPNQRIFVLEIEGYAYLVPFVETEAEIFLKTIIPNRQATKRYLGGG